MNLFDNGKVAPAELNAEARGAVMQVRAMFLAYVDAGFSEEQAMDLLKTQLAAAAGAK